MILENYRGFEIGIFPNQAWIQAYVYREEDGLELFRTNGSDELPQDLYKYSKNVIDIFWDELNGDTEKWKKREKELEQFLKEVFVDSDNFSD